MDYAEEQAMEVEALEAIYMDDFKRLEDGAGALAAFEVTIVPEQGADDDVNHVSIAMHVAYTETYPEAAPELRVRAVLKVDGHPDDGDLTHAFETLKPVRSEFVCSTRVGTMPW